MRSAGAIKAVVLAFAVMQVFALDSSAQPIGWGDLDGDDLAWFYNKPGITLQQNRADEGSCIGLTANWPGESNFAPGLVTEMGAAASAPGRINAGRDNCMIVRGYRRFEIRPGNQRTFFGQFAGRDQELELLVSTAAPAQGVLAAEWRNPFLHPDTPVFAEIEFSAPEPNTWLPREASMGTPAYLKDRGVDELSAGDSLDPGLATIVLAISTADGERGTWNRHDLAFLRVDPATSNAPLTNGHPTFINLGQWDRQRDPNRFQIFQVPAGRYALWRFWDMPNSTDFCLRTVAFDVTAGNVVFAGEWRTARGGPIFVSMNRVDEARAALSSVSNAAASAMQLATYGNGARLPCGMASLPNRVYGFDLRTGASGADAD